MSGLLGSPLQGKLSNYLYQQNSRVIRGCFRKYLENNLNHYHTNYLTNQIVISKYILNHYIYCHPKSIQKLLKKRKRLFLSMFYNQLQITCRV